MQTPKQPEVKYRNDLLVLSRQLQSDVQSSIIPVLRMFESEYVNDAYAEELEKSFDSLRLKYQGADDTTKKVASEFVGEVDAKNKKAFYASIEKAVGVNIQSLIQNEGLNDALRAKTRENVALIKSISDEYLKSIEQAVFEGTVQGSTAGSLVDRIGELGKASENKAKLIARDQTSKINSALTQQRQQALGVTEYVWRTSSDERVRESHKRNNGKTFRWNKPPKGTGHPGHDIQCRCVAQPIIKLDS